MLVQFGNNWIKKIPRTAKLWPSPIWQSEEFFSSNYFQIGQACSPIACTNYQFLSSIEIIDL